LEKAGYDWSYGKNIMELEVNNIVPCKTMSIDELANTTPVNP
jgi:hypothetical protein